MRRVNQEPDYISCSNCGKKVSTTFTPHDIFILRAWVECPECIEMEANKKIVKDR